MADPKTRFPLVAVTLLACGLAACEGETPEVEQAEPQQAEEAAPVEQAEPGEASEVWAFETYDADRSDVIEESEWSEGIRSAWEAWDTNRDQELDRDELRVAMFRSMDTDGDGAITEEEFQPRLAGTLGMSEDYGAWDLDDDDRLVDQEVVRAWDQIGIWDQWDRNRSDTLDIEELGQSWFEAWDEDDSGTLERGEWLGR